ncbi:MAG: hypothetical protein JNK87_18115, partial [Bryobacterales bacterium]|nr:hypothetical protein [Bryobacterales bacterium]
MLPFTAAVLPAELAPAVMLTGMLGGGVSLLAMVGFAILARVKRKAPAFEVRTVWVEWRYGPEEWEEFVGREWQGKKQGAGWAVALCAGGGGLAALMSGQWSAVPGIAGI